MKDIKCEYLNEGNCDIVSEIVSKPIPAFEQNCKLCLSCDKPKQYNEYNKALVSINDLKSRDEQLVTENYLIGQGVGTELKKLIPQFLDSGSCSCRAYALKMNRWGIEGCEERFESIVDYLAGKAQSKKLLSWVPDSATRTVVSRFVQKAIAKAKRDKKSSKFKWFTAITTAPRPDPTIDQCVNSLIVAGFDPVIFAEPESSEVSNALTIRNETKRGVWHNWLYSCKYALANSDADVIMTVQDDALFHPDSFSYAEKVLWPREDAGFVSLYTPKHYTIKKNKELRPVGVNRIQTRILWGSCAMIWDRRVLEAAINTDRAKNWIGVHPKGKNRERKQEILQRRRDNPHLINNSDYAIGDILRRMGRSFWYVDPSPVSHISEHSTINHGGNKGRRNCWRCSDWSEPLEKQAPINFSPCEIVI
tara:strand:- start:12 stop:1271 length:1260 start_codon:yes stop_codon:yes gene_type:complete